MISATGHDLVFDLHPQPDTLAVLTGPVGRRVRRHRLELLAVAAERDVTLLGVFGSVARGEDRQESDVDLLVALPASLGLFGLGRLREELEEVLGATVDLIPAGTVV